MRSDSTARTHIDDWEDNLLIPYISDDEDEHEHEDEDKYSAGFGECWHCGVALPIPRGDDEVAVQCVECWMPN
jgi:uncharacterized membrane protein